MVRIAQDHDGLLPTTQVGAYPRPIWMSGRPIGNRYERDFRDATTQTLFTDATALCLGEQERAGLDLLTDGQQYYEPDTPWERDPVFAFVPSRIGGTELWGEPGPDFLSAYRKCRVVDKVEWVRPIYGPVADTARDLTKRPLKVQMIGPATLSWVLEDHHYKDVEALSMDVAQIYQRELADLAERGVEWVSFVEEAPLWSGGEPWALQCLNEAVDGARVKTSWHSCYGSSRGDQPIMPDGCAPVYGKMFEEEEIRCDDMSFEFCRRDFTELDVFKPFAERPGKSVSVGVIRFNDLTVETPEQVADGLRRAVEALGAENVIASTDCGLLFLRRDIAFRKLCSLVEGTRIVRAEVGG